MVLQQLLSLLNVTFNAIFFYDDPVRVGFTEVNIVADIVILQLALPFLSSFIFGILVFTWTFISWAVLPAFIFAIISSSVISSIISPIVSIVVSSVVCTFFLKLILTALSPFAITILFVIAWLASRRFLTLRPSFLAF